MTVLEVVEATRKDIINTNRKVGTVLCPLCGKSIFFTIHDNGHVHAACENEKCLRWME